MSEYRCGRQGQPQLNRSGSADSNPLRAEGYEVWKKREQHGRALVDLPEVSSQLALSHIPTKVSANHHDIIEQAVCVSLNQLDASSRVFYNIRAFDFLPTVLSEAGPDSHVYAAMRSVGAVNLANRSNSADLHRLVEIEHTRAIAKVAAALADPDRYLRDDTLVAVWLLSKRELFLGIKELNGVVRNTETSYRTHYNGLLTLLRLRGTAQFTNEEGRRLYGFFLAALNWTPLFAGEEPTQEYLNLEAKILATMPTAARRLYEYYHGVCRLRARTKEFLKGGSRLDDFRPLSELYQAASNLDESMEDWCDLQSWMPKQFMLANGFPPRTQTPWTSKTTFRLWYFKGWFGFFHWNKYLVARILLHSLLLDILTEVERRKRLPNNSVGLDDVLGTIVHHTHIFHKTLQNYMGMFAYAFGDIDDNGVARSELTPAIGDGRFRSQRGINVLGSLQIQPPMSFLIKSLYLNDEEREAISTALQRFRAEFQLW